MADPVEVPEAHDREPSPHLVLASYNIHACVGRDGRRDPERIAAVLAELDADVVALQEVDSRGSGGGVPDPLVVLSEATGMASIAGPTLLSDAGHYGNAVLTRLPVRRVARLDLSHPGCEPRGALDLDLDSPAGTLRLIATHLGLRARERAAQMQRLREAIEARCAPLLAVLGDMNDWLPGRLGLRPLRALLGPTPTPRTFPAHRPLLPLDRVWVRPEQALVEVRVHRSPLARRASDHLPLRAVLRDPLRQALLLLLALLLAPVPQAAHAGPPLQTDDPGVVAPGSAELIWAFQGSWQRKAWEHQAPLVDLTLGVAPRLELALTAAARVAEPRGAGHDWDPGPVSAGAKLALLEADEAGGDGGAPVRARASVAPAFSIEPAQPELWTVFLPLELSLEGARRPWRVGLESGFELAHEAPDAWVQGAFVGYRPLPRLELLAEVTSRLEDDLDRVQLGWSAGFDLALAPGIHLLAAVGTGLLDEIGPRNRVTAYLGLQLLWSTRAAPGYAGSSGTAASGPASSALKLSSR